MSNNTHRPLAEALEVANHIQSALAPHCARVEIAGSIRRRRPSIGDVEIVCLPHPYEPAIAQKAGCFATWPAGLSTLQMNGSCFNSSGCRGWSRLIVRCRHDPSTLPRLGRRPR